MSKYVDIVVGLPVEGPFTYKIPDKLVSYVSEGKRVWIPFGRRKIIGYVVEVKNNVSVDDNKLKEIKEVIDDEPIINKELLKLTKQMAEYYFNTWGESIEAVIPPGLKKGKVKLVSRKKMETNLPDYNYTEEFCLNTSQKKAFNKIKEKINSQEHGVLLLHGITASGKTEVYLQAIKQARLKLKGCIVLVPEIALTPQTCERFTARFKDDVAILHSRMLNSHRYAEWEKIKDGKASIVIGPRSAIFAPVKNLGLIVIDEEHEYSYKQEDIPRYHARETAIMRAEKANAVVILGSATPSLESYYNSKTGKYTLLELPERITKKQLPDVQIIDMRDEVPKQQKRSPVFSLALENSLKEVLKKKEQAILFLNRKGFATFIHCIKCGYTEKCKRCSVALTYHSRENSLICHYCNYRKNVPEVCPVCNTSYIRKYGKGTEKVVSEIKKKFPYAKIARMDADTVLERGSYKKILDSFKRHEVDILVGTQMIAKGLDFPKVTLVGVVSADIGLNLPDFRASERTFSLLTQVAGRAGRGEKHGKVIIQTYNPENYAVLTSKAHDYKSFYSKEIKIRRETDFPPFSHLAGITLKSGKEDKLEKVSDELAEILQKSVKSGNVEILGPVPSCVSRIKGKYRYNIMLKSKNLDDIIHLLKTVFDAKRRVKDVYIKVDIDPVSFF